jgi:nicotinamidase-related amidase
MLVRDACSSFDDAWSRVAVEFAVTQLGEVATVDEVITALGHAQAA